MAKPLEKQRAVLLRKNGKSIKTIAKKLAVSSSTVSYWCRDISLTNAQIRTLQHRAKSAAVFALLKSAEEQRKQRLIRTAEAHERGRKDANNLSNRDKYMVGLGLYWGEGYKNGNEELGFTNSDPDMMVFFIDWLNSTYGIKRNDLIARVSINALHKDRVPEVMRFWSNKTGISLNQFTKISLIKTGQKKIYQNMSTHFGTLRIKARRGAMTRRRILGSLEELRRPK